LEHWNYGARLNSFKTMPERFWHEPPSKLTIHHLLERAATVKGLSHVDLNYPQHFEAASPAEMQEALTRHNLTLSGLATRFGAEFANGDFTNTDAAQRDTALRLAFEAAEHCIMMGGDVLTLWFAHDGFDYSFQSDYQALWRDAVDGVRQLAQDFSDLKISIEYKPYQPRAFSVFADVGTVLLALQEIDRPNVGITLDYCHMLMKRERPTFSLALSQLKQRLYGIHLNDGYGDNDDGMMVGSVNLLALIEFVYHLKHYNYDGMIYFDTFPEAVDPVAECQANIDTINAVNHWISRYGEDKLAAIIRDPDPISSQRILIDLLHGH
jgi:xylose isomerase